jgi:hypothetical protein
MAIRVGTNDLKIFRRHQARCSRYPSGFKKPFTSRPTTPKDKKADSCECPIWCLVSLQAACNAALAVLWQREDHPRIASVHVRGHETTCGEVDIESVFAVGLDQ